MELELATAPEIAEELLDRNSFKGVVIYSKQSCLDGIKNRKKETYSICYNQNLDKEEVVNLLRLLANNLEGLVNEGND